MKSSVFKKENILKKIIMVSTNNTCRSFIAESILRQYLLDADQKNVEVISRGLVVLFPEPVHVKAADMVIKTCGIESLDFRSAQLTQEEVEESDLILTMTEEQKDKILEEYHGYKEIATLNEYARVEGAIIDPYGMEDDDYERCFEQIARLVKKIWQERLGGISITANKIKGIRAALCSDTFSAHATREHNDANILAMGARVVGEGLALDIVDTFLETEFSNDERHIRRINMIED